MAKKTNTAKPKPAEQAAQVAAHVAPADSVDPEAKKPVEAQADKPTETSATSSDQAARPENKPTEQAAAVDEAPQPVTLTHRLSNDDIARMGDFSSPGSVQIDVGSVKINLVWG